MGRRSIALVVLLGACTVSEPPAEPPTLHLVRYEVEACCADSVPEITYTPYWSPRWGLRNRVALRADNPSVPWAYSFRSDHLQRLTVTAYGDIGLECRVFVDGQLVDEGHADNEVSCGARPPE